MSQQMHPEALALLKVLSLGNRDVAAGRTKPVADVIARLRAKRTELIVRAGRSTKS